jgi:tetratricopeptide (TPR) repeat protein
MATSEQRARWFGSWLAIADECVRRGGRGQWEANVIRQTLEAGTFVLELDPVADLDEFAGRLRSMAEDLGTRVATLDSTDASRAWHSIAGMFRMFVEMSLSEDADADLKVAFDAAAKSAASIPSDLSPEMRARRHQTVRAIAVQLAKRTGVRAWWDTAVEHGRLSVGLPPLTSQLPDSTAQDDAGSVTVELSARWQGLSIAYRNRAEVDGDFSDLAAAVRSAEIAVSLVPPGSSYRGGALMALGGALMTLADHVDDPAEALARATDAYRLAVELPDAGAARRQSRLSAFGTALRRRADLTADDRVAAALLTEAIRSIAAALRLCRPGADSAPRFMCNLANAVADRATRTGSPAGADQALRFYRQAVSRMQAAAPVNLVDLRYGQALLANHLLGTGEHDQALHFFSQALSDAALLGPERYTQTARGYASALLATGDSTGAVDALLRAAREVQQAAPILADWLRDDASVLTLTHGGGAPAAAELAGCRDAHLLDFLVIQGDSAGAVLTFTEDGWKVSTAPDPQLSRSELRRARERLQRPFRDDPDRQPDTATVSDAIAATDFLLPSQANTGKPPVLRAILVDYPAALLPLSVTAGWPVTVRPRPWAPKAVTASSGDDLLWTGLFADDETLTQIAAERADLKSIYRDRLFDRSGNETLFAPLAGRGLHIAAHGQRTRGQFGFVLDPSSPPVTVAELISAGSPPSIVVLTVCPAAADTARGRSHSPVAQQFLAAGSSVVISPLWPVRDSAAAWFAAALHRKLSSAAGDRLVGEASVATSEARDEMRAARSHPGGSLMFDNVDWAAWTCWSLVIRA